MKVSSRCSGELFHTGRSAKLISRDLLADQNPTVVANAVAALLDISERSDEIELRLNSTVAGKLVAALGECSEYVIFCACRRMDRD